MRLSAATTRKSSEMAASALVWGGTTFSSSIRSTMEVTRLSARWGNRPSFFCSAT
jgi:hypothetical protein